MPLKGNNKLKLLDSKEGAEMFKRFCTGKFTLIELADHYGYGVSYCSRIITKFFEKKKND